MAAGGCRRLIIVIIVISVRTTRPISAILLIFSAWAFRLLFPFLVYASRVLLSCFLLFRKGMDPMHGSDLVGLDLDLEKADIETLREIIREAEKFLDSQLQAGIAGDQRAITFSSVISAVVAVLVGGFITVISSPNYPPEVTWVVVPLTAGFLLSLVFAFAAGRPTDWYYAGSNPRHWREEVVKGDSLTVSLAGQAKLYATGILANHKILERNAKMMWWALGLSGVTLLVGIGVSIYAVAVGSTPVTTP